MIILLPLPGLLQNIGRTAEKTRCQKMLCYAAKAAPARRVLIVDTNLLLGAGVETILKPAADMLVQGDNPPTKAALFQTISSINPQVIIFDEATPLIEETDMLSLLKTYPTLQLVTLSTENDWVKIYSK